MRWALTGSHGLIGSALARRLEADGQEVLRLVREGADGPGRVYWDPAARRLDPAVLEAVDVVVHLAGAGIGDRRWTRSRKDRIVASRVEGTATVAGALAATSAPAAGKVLVSVSAVGYYGSRCGVAPLTEESPPGPGFLAGLCRQWEAAADPARSAGARVVHPRLGLVLSAAGGVLGRMLPLFRLGLGGRLGDGEQYLSWVTRHDAIEAIIHLARDASVSGPVNLTAPQPVTNRELTAGLARELRRPAVLRVPAAVLRVALGREMADETVLAGQRVLPAALVTSGFEFSHPDLPSGLRAALADSTR